jgi:Zn ribbon nucleic-acid-binding protein
MIKQYVCPKCENEDIAGNGDNTCDCMACGYHFHETETKIIIKRKIGKKCYTQTQLQFTFQ